MDGRIEPRSTDAEMEGLDETQRAEVHAYEGGGPSDGDILTDMTRDRGEDYVEDDMPSELAPGAPEDAAMSGDEFEEVAEGEDDDDI